MNDSQKSFYSLEDWYVNAPDMGSELSPSPDCLTETYQEWLNHNPQGCIVEAA